MLSRLQDFALKLYRHGVILLVGTDAPMGELSLPWGEALIEELGLLMIGEQLHRELMPSSDDSRDRAA